MANFTRDDSGPFLDRIDREHLERALALLGTQLTPALKIIAVAYEDSQMQNQFANTRTIRVLAELGKLCQRAHVMGPEDQERQVVRMDRQLRVATLVAPGDSIQALAQEISDLESRQLADAAALREFGLTPPALPDGELRSLQSKVTRCIDDAEALEPDCSWDELLETAEELLELIPIAVALRDRVKERVAETEHQLEQTETATRDAKVQNERDRIDRRRFIQTVAIALVTFVIGLGVAWLPEHVGQRDNKSTTTTQIKP